LNTLKTRAHQAAAMTGATVSFIGLDLPYNLGLIFGGLVGIIVGVLFKRFSQ
jgi:hypothetical protein